VLAIGSRYCDLHEEALVAAPDPATAIHDAVRRGLTHASTDQAFRTVLTPDGSDTFLPLYTNEAKPLLDLFTTRLTKAWRNRWPDLDPERLRIAITAGNRLVLSYVLLPERTPEQVADDFGALFGDFLVSHRLGGC
jgi:hypothetical protein